MTSFRYSFFSILIVFLLSCNSTKNIPDTSTQHHITEHNIIESIGADEFVATYNYIVLADSPTTLIGEVEKLKVADESLYILSENQVFVYDLTGKFQYKINRPRRGPGEYLKIYSISLDNNTLYIYDNRQRKVLRFDASSGEYRGSDKLQHSVKDIQFVDGHFYADRGKIPNSVVTGNERLLIGKLNDQLNIQAYFQSDGDNAHLLESYGGEVFWVDPMFNTIYRADSTKGTVPFIFYDFGSSNVTPIDLKDGIRMTKLGEEGKIFNLQNTYSNGKFMVSNINYANQSALMLYNLQEKTNSIFLEVKNPPYASVPLAHATDEGQFYKVIPPWEVMAMKGRMKELNYSPEAGSEAYRNAEIINERTATDNPLIAVFNFK